MFETTNQHTITPKKGKSQPFSKTIRSAECPAPTWPTSAVMASGVMKHVGMNDVWPSWRTGLNVNIDQLWSTSIQKISLQQLPSKQTPYSKTILPTSVTSGQFGWFWCAVKCQIWLCHFLSCAFYHKTVMECVVFNPSWPCWAICSSPPLRAGSLLPEYPSH